MKRQILVLILICGILPYAHAQQIAASQNTKVNTHYKKTFYMSMFGPYHFMGGNFDMRLNPGQNDGLGFRVGIGRVKSLWLDGVRTSSSGVITIPMGVNYLMGEGNSHFLVEGGLLPAVFSSTASTTYNRGLDMVGGYAALGYRYQPARKGFMWQITWNPMMMKGEGIKTGRLEIGLGGTFW